MTNQPNPERTISRMEEAEKMQEAEAQKGRSAVSSQSEARSVQQMSEPEVNAYLEKLAAMGTPPPGSEGNI